MKFDKKCFLIRKCYSKKWIKRIIFVLRILAEHLWHGINRINSDKIRKIVEIRTRGQDGNKKNGKEIVQNETLAKWYENMVKYEWLILEELLQDRWIE